MPNCYICGQKKDVDELDKSGDVGGISIGSYHLNDNEYVCKDVEDCEYEQDNMEEFNAYSEIEDTPSLDPPPWAYK